MISVSDLTALRCPRSSGGSLRSLAASITVDRRSVIFLLELFGEGVDELLVEEEEARRGLGTPWPKIPIDGDDAAALATRVAMARRERDRETVGGELCLTERPSEESSVGLPKLEVQGQP